MTALVVIALVGLAVIVTAPRPAQHSGITSTGLAARAGAPLDRNAAGSATQQRSGGAPRPAAPHSSSGSGYRALTPERLGSSPSWGANLAATSRSGWATWCAPTPTRCHGWGGRAMLGAAPSFRYGDEPYTVQVCGFTGGRTNCVLVTVVSFCGCRDRGGVRTVIDLSPYAFSQLAPLSVGVIRVSVDHVRERVPAAPQTDVGP